MKMKRSMEELLSSAQRKIVSSVTFKNDVADIVSIAPDDFLNLALEAGNNFSIRRKVKAKNVDEKVKKVLLHMNLSLRKVHGSDAQREVLWMKFNAMRIWKVRCWFIFQMVLRGSPGVCLWTGAMRTCESSMPIIIPKTRTLTITSHSSFR